MHRRRAAAHGDEEGDAPSGEGVGHGAAEHSGARAICVCVDDFGLHAGVNEAALRLAAMGRVHAIGCLVGGPAWPAGAARLRALPAEAVDVGLHLDFTERPCGPASRRGLAALIASSLAGRLDAGAVRAEIGAQLQAFEAALGRAPAFVDGHQHVHQLPVIRGALLHELSARYGAARPWLRRTRVGGRPGTGRLPAWAKARVIETLGAGGLAVLARAAGYPQNTGLLGVYDFRGGAARYRTLLAAWLHAAAEGDLLMCHPSAAMVLTDPLADPLLGARCAEYAVLGGPAFEALRRDAALTLMPMSRILAGAPAGVNPP
ncbi:MAG: ChbG/HpnK family deacetylase [Rhizobacter sp.]|nr:ChbG/HpnK family deacetylase [Rhizobacter sp.]